MGGLKSKDHPTTPPPSPLQRKPWRELEWDTRDEMKDNLRNFKISTPDVKHLRILVYGPVGAGKSSFINSIDSIFQERLTSGAIAEACAGSSFTKIYNTHKIKDGGYESYLPFDFSDVMGLERGDQEGVQTKDLEKILEGHIKEGYMFNPLNSHPPEKDNDYKAPGLSDRIHCLVSVIPADSVLWCADGDKISDHAMRENDEAFIKKIKDVRAHASLMGIPQIVVLSKVDEACSKVQNDIKMIYRSKTIREKVKHCSHNVGVPEYCIFPVKNYHEENRLNKDMDVLLLTALKEILNFANDYVAKEKMRVMKREEDRNFH
ncbi:interferon-induced protein 44-like [Sardina pilchardus]|uniref:interferon-induced protein 44-like n=1 Tax=Sardina pilchardus TaxID=27697 RepID=UPI002E0DB481